MSPSRGSLTTRRTLFAAITTVLVLHLIVYRSTHSLRTQHSLHLLNKRTLVVEHKHNNHRPYPPDQHEPQTEALIDWLELYKHTSNSNKPFLFTLMALWLVFLFAFVGICASEFFCPNLSHIASRLGLSESVAGVTFLAFSNGSPDVFSTFSALKSDAGSLAIGELIGAASFIVSVVAGSMALITPFRVARHTFLRDVGFFTLAVLLTLTILYDSHIHLWEALTMVGLYIVYVVYVGVGSWWESRRDEKKRKIREAREEYDATTGLGFDTTRDHLLELGDESQEDEERQFGEGGDIEWEPEEGVIRLPISGSTSPRSTRSISPAYSSESIIYHRRPSHAHSTGSQTPPLLSHSHSRSRSTSLINPSTPHSHRTRPPPTPLLATPSLSTSTPNTVSKKTTRVVRPSLLGAIEFRDVVNSLSQEKNFNARDVLGVFGSEREGRSGVGRPGMHSRTHSSSSGMTRSPRSERGGGEVEWDWNGWGTSSEGSRQQRKSEGKGRKRASTSPQGMGGGVSGLLRLDGEDDVLSTGVLRRLGREEGSDEEVEEEEGSDGTENPWKEELEQRANAKAVKKVPSILLTSANGSDTLIPTTTNLEEGGSSSITVTGDVEDGTSTIRPSPKSPSSSSSTRKIPSRRRLLLSATLSALFPSLDQFTSKSIIGKITAIMCVPALLVLNLTLPVAEEPSGEIGSDECWEEKEEDEVSARGVPKGIRLPDDGTGDDGSLLINSSDEEEEDDRVGASVGGQAAARVGKKLHSPAVAHPHSHHLSNSHPHDQDQDPSVSPSFPWANPTSNLPTPHSNAAAPLHSPSSYFKIKTSSEQGTINRISSNSSGDDEDGEATHEVMQDKLREREECLAGRKVTRCLTAVQCTLGPIFCTCALFADELEWYQPLLALLLGLFFATLAYRFFHDPRHPGRVTLCFVGFGIAMVWILMIVNEVVGVLQTFGHIFGISDAILGLTIFAMGNSLGDLVANATVARMGYPSMAIAACFGGPMLNILLGVGLSGTYLIASSPTHEPIHVDMGRTLMVSGVGLFAILAGSLVVVPMNGYKMSKRIGAIFIGAYTVVLSINVAAEIWL